MPPPQVTTRVPKLDMANTSGMASENTPAASIDWSWSSRLERSNRLCSRAAPVYAFTTRHADQVLLQPGVQGGDLLLDHPKQGPALARHEREQGEHRHHHRHHVQGQPPVGDEQQVQAADHQQHGGDDLDDAGADEGAHHVDVAGGPGQKLAGLGAVMVAERQALDVIVEGIAQVVGHALGNPGGQHPLQVGEQRTQHRHREDDHGARSRSPASGRRGCRCRPRAG